MVVFWGDSGRVSKISIAPRHPKGCTSSAGVNPLLEPELRVRCQVAWHGRENEQKAENGKKFTENLTIAHGQRWGKIGFKGPKIERSPQIRLFAFCFPHFWPWAFSIFRLFFLSFRPVFHSTPGHLNPKARGMFENPRTSPQKTPSIEREIRGHLRKNTCDP